ncbi:MAG TPA: hypothetical protein VID75_10215 [Acidimicrobiales bacterium]
MPERPEVQYLVLADRSHPFLLARVRWPDVAQAISAGCPDWLDDVGLFDLPNDPSSVPVTLARAAEIALGWGAQLPSDGSVRTTRPALVRRMPANWSNLTPAERRAWSLDVVTTPRRVDRIGWRARVAMALGDSRLARRRPDIPVNGASREDDVFEPQSLVFEPQSLVSEAPPDPGPLEDLWAPETTPVPAVAMNGHSNGAGTNGHRLPTVFSKMAEGSSPGPGIDAGDGRDAPISS